MQQQYSRHGQSPRKDHSPDFFYQVSNTESMYRRNRDIQATDPINITKPTRQGAKSPQLENTTMKEVSNTAYSPGRLLNCRMQNKYFHHSNIFEGVQAPKQYIERQSEVQHQAPLTSSNGAVVNKDYNTTKNKAAPIVNNAKSITIEFNADSQNLDQLEIKRSLLKHGIQVTDMTMKNPLNSGRNKNQGSLTVRGQDANLLQLPQALEQFGLKTQQKQQNHQLNHHNKEWIGQKLNYEKIGYFQKNTIKHIIPPKK